MRYSYSSLESFKNCALQFKYKYIDKLTPPIKTTIEAFMGSMVHLALEKLYSDLKYNKLLTLEQLLDFYHKSWTTNFDPTSTEIVKKEFTEQNYKSLGSDYLTTYYNNYKPFDEGKTLGLEVMLNFSLYDEVSKKSYSMIGFIDRLTLLSNNHISIIDYKTNNTPKTQEEVDNDSQLALYSIAIKEKYPFVEKIDLCWHFLSAGIKQISSRTPQALELLKKQTIQTIKEIEACMEKNDFVARPSALCDWCSYKSICPLKSHDILINKLQLSENEYLKEEGVFLVNKYLEVSNSRKSFLEKTDFELERLKQAILSYSKKNNIERIFGSTHSLLIKHYSSYKIPLKDTEERKQLEALLKESDFWPMLSELSYISLFNFLKQDFFEDAFKKKILNFLKQDTITKLYLNKK